MERLIQRGLGTTYIILVCVLTLSIAGCLTEGSGEEGGTEVVANPDQVPAPPLTPPERTVCDPFNAGVSARDRGLIGNLVYLTDDQPRYTRARDYIMNGVPVQSTLYFDRLMIPTRSWDLGFYTQDGTLVTNHRDEPVYEYFGVHMESQLQLAPGEAPGWYQMAILSDDGAVLSLKDDENVLTTLVDNDGDHPTRMGCAMRSIYLNEGDRLPFTLEYYQGPRYHISLVVMWRPLPADQNPEDPVWDEECGMMGNSRYFDYTQVPSLPTPRYYEMLTRGWKPLENANYFFPEQASNPCAVDDPLIISNFVIETTTRTSITVSWQTNQPATTKVVARNVVTGEIHETEVDTTLKTSHVGTISGLSSDTLYAIRAVSAVEGGDPVFSNELAIRTPR